MLSRDTGNYHLFRIDGDFVKVSDFISHVKSSHQVERSANIHYSPKDRTSMNIIEMN